MKKLMIMAAAALMAVSAMAQNPDALKQIKKCKTAEEATALIQQNTASMTAAENAQAYNKLVDIYFSPVEKDFAEIQAAQLTKSKPKVDMDVFNQNLLNAFNAAEKCDEFDIQPNDKGKVSPKFRKSNGSRLYSYRISLLMAGQSYQEKEDNAKALNYYDAYVVSGVSPLFADAKASAEKMGQKDEYLGEVARVAAFLSVQAKNYDHVDIYADILTKNPETANTGIQVQLAAIESQTGKNHADSVASLEKVKAVYAKYPTSNMAFTQLAQWYANMGMQKEENDLIVEYLQKDPNCLAAYALRGQNEMSAQKYDEAIADFEKASQCTTEDELQKGFAFTYLGYCYLQKASQLEKKAEQKPLIEKATAALESARKIDPNRERGNWAYPLYQCYYQLYGDADARTKEVAGIAGIQ